MEIPLQLLQTLKEWDINNFIPVIEQLSWNEQSFWKIQLTKTRLKMKCPIIPSLSRIWLFATPWTVTHQAPLSYTVFCANSYPLSQWCCLTLSYSAVPLLLPSAFPSIRVFSHESALHIRWPKYWSFSINPSNEYSGLISFRIDWFDLPAVQGTLESFSAPQSESISSSVLSLLCVTILTSVQDYWKTIALIIWTFVDKMMSLLFNTV